MKRRYILTVAGMILLLGAFSLLGIVTKPIFDGWAIEQRTVLISLVGLAVLGTFCGTAIFILVKGFGRVDGN